LKSFPRQVRRDIGEALYAAQESDMDPAAKPLKGSAGSTVLEIAVYILHAFQKKSKRGIATPKREIDLIRQRLAEAERDYRKRQN
jgi:phage-related protein